MPLDLEKLGNIFGQDTIKKVYEDGASPAVQETGKALTDLVKTFRLFMVPIQLLAAYQDRLSRHLEKVRNSVKEENQIEAPSSISGPVIEKLKYLEDDNYLTRLYLNLLSRSIDKERVDQAHPAFCHIIEQLSSDEAYILYFAKSEPLEIITIYPPIKGDILTLSGTPQLPVTAAGKVTFPHHLNMYLQHLESLAIIKIEPLRRSATADRTIPHGLITSNVVVLTDFGKLFAQACIPDKSSPI